MGQKASKLNREDISSLKSETKFTTRELQQWYKGFKRDAPSGKLTKEDYIKIHQQFYPFGDPEEFATYAFKATDLKDQGYVDFKDFIISLSIASRGKMSDKLKWAFRIYDQDRDGYVGYDDILRVIRSIYAMTGSDSVVLKENDVTPETRVGRIWVGFHKSLAEKDTGKVSLKEFSDYKNIDPEVLNALSIYNDLV